MNEFATAIEEALKVMGKAEAVTALVTPAVTTVTRDLATVFMSTGEESVNDWLVDDPERMRMRVKGIALANEINSETDWAAVPGEVLSAAMFVLRTAAGIAAFL